MLGHIYSAVYLKITDAYWPPIRQCKLFSGCRHLQLRSSVESLDKEDLEGHCVKSLLKIVLAQTSQVKMLSDVVDYIL
jgi:hypothetical protein